MSLPLPPGTTLDHHQLRPHNGLCGVKLEKAYLTLLYLLLLAERGLALRQLEGGWGKTGRGS